MPKEKKQKFQDVIPRRSIRDIELSKNKEVKLPEAEKSTYKYTYDKPKKNSKKWLYIAIGFFIVAIAFGISALFKSAKIKVSPKEQFVSLNNTFTAKKDSGSDLSFQLVTVTKSAEKTVTASLEKAVQIKARGKIVIYNNFSANPQKLIVTTRFQTPEGLIFRLINNVAIPGRKTVSGKQVAGSLEALVEADKAGSNYNITLKDFTIPAFKGDPKYTEIYGRSKTEMSGGFSGMQKVVSKEETLKTNSQLEAELKDSLIKDILSQIPANFVLYRESISYNFEPVIQARSAKDGVVLSKKGTANAVIFDKGSLSKAISAKLVANVDSNLIKTTNLDKLNFSFETTTPFSPSSSSDLKFNLKGEANFVWIFDQNKLKADLLGLSKKNAKSIIATYPAIKEAWIETKPFWNQTIPLDPKKVNLINTFK